MYCEQAKSHMSKHGSEYNIVQRKKKNSRVIFTLLLKIGTKSKL